MCIQGSFYARHRLIIFSLVLADIPPTPQPPTMITFPSETPQSPTPSSAQLPPPPPSPSLIDFPAPYGWEYDEEDVIAATTTDINSDIIPAPYPFREDWETFEFPPVEAPLPQLYDVTASTVINGEIEDVMVEEPFILTAEPTPSQTRETRAERRKRRRAARKKAKACHQMFCRLPR